MIDYIREHFHPLWSLRKNSLFRQFQEKFDPDFSCLMNGISVSVKLIRDASVILPHAGKEVVSRRAFTEILKKHQIQLLFDVGANIGSYSWTAIENGVEEVFLFEPDTTNQRLLNKTIRKNSLKQCYLVPFAVSDGVGVADFIIDRASGATGSLEDQTNNPASLHHAYGLGPMTKVPTLNLDIFTGYAKTKKVMVKIDVEGAEGDVFKGGKRFFKEVLPFVLVECFEESRLAFFDQFDYSIEPLAENCNYLLLPPGS